LFCFGILPLLTRDYAIASGEAREISFFNSSHLRILASDLLGRGKPIYEGQAGRRMPLPCALAGARQGDAGQGKAIGAAGLPRGRASFLARMQSPPSLVACSTFHIHVRVRARARAFMSTMQCRWLTPPLPPLSCARRVLWVPSPQILKKKPKKKPKKPQKNQKNLKKNPVRRRKKYLRIGASPPCGKRRLCEVGAGECGDAKSKGWKHRRSRLRRSETITECRKHPAFATAESLHSTRVLPAAKAVGD